MSTWKFVCNIFLQSAQLSLFTNLFIQSTSVSSTQYLWILWCTMQVTYQDFRVAGRNPTFLFVKGVGFDRILFIFIKDAPVYRSTIWSHSCKLLLTSTIFLWHTPPPPQSWWDLLSCFLQTKQLILQLLLTSCRRTCVHYPFAHYRSRTLIIEDSDTSSLIL